MISFLLRPLRQLALALGANDSPHQVAWGFTLGMIAGLVPKGNLLAIVLMVLLCALQVNKSAGVLAMAMFTVAGHWLDGFAHALGAIALAWQPVRPLHTWLYELPLGPWLGLNNTVVLGQLLLGFYFAYPVYCLTRMTITKIRPRVALWLGRHRATRWLTGIDLAATWGIDT